MTGVLNVMVGSIYFEILTVTVEADGLGAGYSDSGGFGSISPGTFRGKSVTAVRSPGATRDFQVAIDDASALPQNFFTRITVEDGTGTLRTYLSTDAVFASGGVGGETWSWGDASNPVFSPSDDSEQHQITFYL